MYTSAYIRYDRTDNFIYPTKITKAWVTRGNKRTFETVREEVTFLVMEPHDDAYPEVKQRDTRASLLASGVIREAGYGLPCLTLK